MEQYYSVPLTIVKGQKVRDEFIHKVSTERIIVTKTKKGFRDIFTGLEFKVRDILSINPQEKAPNLNLDIPVYETEVRDPIIQEEIAFNDSIYYIDRIFIPQIREATPEDFADYCDGYNDSKLKAYYDDEALYDPNFRWLPSFIVKKFPEEKKLRYYRSLRRQQYEKGTDLRGYKIRRLIRPLLRKLVKDEREKLSQTKFLDKDESTKPADKTLIYAITHVGLYDMTIGCEQIEDDYYILCGDPETMYNNMDGAFAELCGVVYIEADCKKDRFIAKEKCVRVLGVDDLYMYPEGIWNAVDPCRLVLPLYPGIVEMAYRANAEIVPVAIEQFDKHFVISIGENIDINPFFADGKFSQENIDAAKREIRDQMATQKWYILEKYSLDERESLPSDYMETYMQARIDEWPHYTKDTFKERTYREKGVVSPDEAFAHLDKIKQKQKVFIPRKK